MIQSIFLLLRSLRSSRMIIIALFNQTLDWLSFIDGHIRRGVKSHIRRSAFIEPNSQDAHQSSQRESESGKLASKTTCATAFATKLPQVHSALNV
eukprot:3808534-Amphidinium_carterae.1